MGQLQRREEDSPDESLPGGSLTLDTCKTCGVPMVILGPLPAGGPVCDECRAKDPTA